MPVSTVSISGVSSTRTFKTWAVHFDEVDRGFKRFEVRKLEHAPRIGERIRLIEHKQRDDGSTGIPTGRALDVLVTRPVIDLGTLDPKLSGWFAFSITLPKEKAPPPIRKMALELEAEAKKGQAYTRRPSNPFAPPRCSVPGCSQDAWHCGKCWDHYPSLKDLR